MSMQNNPNLFQNIDSVISIRKNYPLVYKTLLLDYLNNRRKLKSCIRSLRRIFFLLMFKAYFKFFFEYVD